jgi:diaphanous 1
MQVGSGVEALKKMTSTLENDLRALLVYFGEHAEGPDALKPEDFFSMICSFSSSLQKAALELPETKARMAESASIASSASVLSGAVVRPNIREPEDVPEDGAGSEVESESEGTLKRALANREADDTANSTLKIPGQAQGQGDKRSTGYAAGHSVGRGDLDQAIRSMRDGRRRARPDRETRRPLSKMFIDGSANPRRSRIYE